MRRGETLSLTITLPNEQQIKIPDAVVRWSRDSGDEHLHPVVGPGAHVLFLECSVPLLEDYAELVQILLNLDEILLRDFVPFTLQGSFELIPVLAELFLILLCTPW